MCSLIDVPCRSLYTFSEFFFKSRQVQKNKNKIKRKQKNVIFKRVFFPVALSVFDLQAGPFIERVPCKYQKVNKFYSTNSAEPGPSPPPRSRSSEQRGRSLDGWTCLKLFLIVNFPVLESFLFFARINKLAAFSWNLKKMKNDNSWIFSRKWDGGGIEVYPPTTPFFC